MISISLKDQAVVRFLWVKDINDEEPKLVKMRSDVWSLIQSVSSQRYN